MCGGNSSTHFPSSQKVDRKNPWVGLLARKVRITYNRFAGRFTFPGIGPSGDFEATRLHSQWRDRAGFTPDFPVMPSWAPKANRNLSTAPCRKCARERRSETGDRQKARTTCTIGTQPVIPAVYGVKAPLYGALLTWNSSVVSQSRSVGR